MNGDDSRGGDRHSSSRYRDDRDRGHDRDRREHRDRRRSRSPRGERGGYRSRRDEPDSYSSSRDHRDRERERNFNRRDDDRGGWGRDRGRGDRGDDRRRDRDMDDRRGGGRRDRDRDRDRDGFGGRGGDRERKRSATPPVKKREPTPDLTPYVPILERQRRMTQWDIKPPGYENITAEQAKLSGMFPLPGAPRQQPMDPARLQAMVSQPANMAETSTLKPTMARQAKRLFIYNLPAAVSQEQIVEFINLQLNGVNLVKAHDPCMAAHKAANNPSSAMLEFKNPSDATVALALDGISMTSDAMDTSNGNSGLSIQRPKDYIGPPAAPPSEADAQNGVSKDVPDTTQKLMITNLAPFLDEEQVKQLLIAIGPLRALALAVDDTGASRGFAFCEYADPQTTDVAMEGLNGMDIGGQAIKLQRACAGQEQLAGELGVTQMSLLAGSVSANMEKTRTIQMLNMTTTEELINDDDYEDLNEDILEEVQKYGKVEGVKIPRPAGARTSAGVGKVYVKFEDTEAAQRAHAGLAGRKYADRTVVVSFFSDEYFDLDAW